MINFCFAPNYANFFPFLVIFFKIYDCRRQFLPDFYKKNVPWHILAPRAVACDKIPRNFLLQKTGPHTAYRHMRTCLFSAYHTLIDHFPVKRLLLDQLRDQVKRQTDHT